MRIFVADERPRQRHAAVRGAYERCKSYGFEPPRRLEPVSGVKVAARRKRTRRVGTGARQVFEPPGRLASAQEGFANSGGRLTRLARHCFRRPPGYVTTIEGKRPCDHETPF
jgi:hypothetical protein